MKKLFALLLLSFCATTAVFAESYFPGLKTIMTPEEFKRAGLDKLTADQLGVIDAAIIKHYVRTIENAATQQNVEAADPGEKGWMARFGLPTFSEDYRDQASIKARCTAWVGGNSFRLDNGQVWEGLETISFELVGKDIEIQPRPGNLFNLVVDDKNTTIRVRRIK